MRAPPASARWRSPTTTPWAASPPRRPRRAPSGIDCLPASKSRRSSRGRDVHILAYGFDPADEALAAFLVRQREDRRRRVDRDGRKAHVARHAGRFRVRCSTDAPPRRSAPSGVRPLAAALVSTGHARDIADAFDRFLGSGRPAFVERSGSPPRDVFALVRAAGGVSSIAHPVKIGDDDASCRSRRRAADAIEVHHPDHDAAATARYRTMADDAGLLVTGGSDYHGRPRPTRRRTGPRRAAAADFDRLWSRVPGAVRRG